MSPRRPGPCDGHPIKEGNDSPISPLLAPSCRPPPTPPLPPRALINFQTNLFIASRRLPAQVTAAPNGSFISPPRSTDFALTLRGKKKAGNYSSTAVLHSASAQRRGARWRIPHSRSVSVILHFKPARPLSKRAVGGGARGVCGGVSPPSQSEGWTFDSRGSTPFCPLDGTRNDRMIFHQSEVHLYR